MKLIITSIVAIIFIAAGSFAGIVLKTPSSASASAGDDHGDDHADDHGDDHGDHH